MNIRFNPISVILFSSITLQSQLPITEKDEQVQSSKYISIPNEIEKELRPLGDTEAVGLITFSKSMGAILSHVQTTIKEVLNDLAKTGFMQRYFILLIDKKAILYLEN